MATLEITAAVVLAAADSCPRTNAGLPPSITLVNIRQPHRKARQFVVIAVLLHWSRFSYSLVVLLVFRMRLSRPRGTTHHLTQSCPLFRRTTGRLPGEIGPGRGLVTTAIIPLADFTMPSRRKDATCRPAFPGGKLAETFAAASWRLVRDSNGSRRATLASGAAAITGRAARRRFLAALCQLASPVRAWSALANPLPPRLAVLRLAVLSVDS